MVKSRVVRSLALVLTVSGFSISSFSSASASGPTQKNEAVAILPSPTVVPIPKPIGCTPGTTICCVDLWSCGNPDELRANIL